MHWLYKHGTIAESTPPDNVVGFVYELLLKDGRKYIGKKNFWSVSKKTLKKNGDRRPNSELVVCIEKMDAKDLSNRTPAQLRTNVRNKRVTYEYVKTESNWRDYYGSSDRFETSDVVERRILEVAKTKRALTYLEVKWMFVKNVLESDIYINGNILNKFHDNVLES